MQTENKMAIQPVGRLIFQMSVPPLISMFLQYSYNFIDSAFVARLSENALTAVSLSFPITTLMNAVSVWIGVGVNVLIAAYLGKKEQEKADTAVTLGLFLAIITGVVLNAVAVLIMKPYYRAFTDDAEIYSLCLTYMGICAYMQVPNMVHIVIQKIVQATGNMWAPMWFQIAGVVFNFVFDPILIFGLGVFPKMGIAGAAVSTVLGYTLSMLIAIFVLFGTNQKVRPKIGGLTIEKKMIKEVFILGLPSFIMNALGSFMVMLVNIFLVAYSTTAIAFFGVYFKVQQLIVMTVNGLIQGCLPVMRFNFGAGNRERLHQSYFYGKILITGAMALGTFVVILFPDKILGLFAASDSMLSFGIGAMRIMAMGFLFNGLSTVIATYLQAIERVTASIIINLLRQCLLLLLFIFILEKICGLKGIWIAFPITELFTFVLAFFIDKRYGKHLKFDVNNDYF